MRNFVFGELVKMQREAFLKVYDRLNDLSYFSLEILMIASEII